MILGLVLREPVKMRIGFVTLLRVPASLRVNPFLANFWRVALGATLLRGEYKDDILLKIETLNLEPYLEVQALEIIQCHGSTVRWGLLVLWELTTLICSHLIHMFWLIRFLICYHFS